MCECEVHAFKQKMAATFGETPPRKKRKRAPDDPFAKNVVVLRNERDVTQRDDAVLMPDTTIEMSRIKRRENGQFQKVTFKCSMTDEEIKTLLQEIFPFLRGQRFYCASAADNRTRLDFHGEPCIWNGAFINSKITGNSALYIFSEENNDHLLNAGMENLHIAETVATTVEDVSDASDDSGFESPGDSCSNMRGDLPTNRSTSPPLDVQVFYPINEELNKTFSEYPSADDWVLCEVHYDDEQEENYQNATAAESSSTVCHDVEQEETCQGAAAEISSTVHHDVQQDETCQGAASGNSSTVHHDVTAGATAENSVPEIVPSSDSVKGGKKFHVTLPEKLPDNIQSGTVFFGDNEVPVKKIDSSTFSGFIPAAQQPGRVTVLVFGEANEYLGSAQFLYEDEMEKLISQLAEDPAGWSKLVKLLSQHDVNVLQNTGAQQPGQADVLLACTEGNKDEMERVILQFAVDPAEMSKLFRLLSQQYDVKRMDSNAVGTGDEQILKNGQLSCSEESDDSQSDYFADAENSSCISLELDSDWSDTEDMVEPTNSFCIPLELDSNWSDSEDRVEPINSSCSLLELDSDWSDSEDMVEPINSSCSSLELNSDWSDSEDRVEASSFILPSHGDTHGAFHTETRSTPRKRSSWSICRLSVEESGSPVEHYYNTECNGSFFTGLQKAYQEKSSGREEERMKQCSGEYSSQAEGHAAQVQRSNHHVTTDAASHKYKHDLTFINAEQPSNAESVISTPVNNTQKGNTSAENKVGEVTRGDKATQQVEATINDIIHGLTEDCSSIPLETLRAKTLNLLESDDSCLEVLGNVLEYLEYFQQHVAADEIIADVTDKDDLDDLKDKLSQAATKQWPRNDCASSYRRSSSNSPMRRSLPGHNQLQGQHKSLKHQLREFGHETDKEFNVDAMTKGAVQMISDQTNPKATREWPVWSLLSSENKKHERAVNVAIKDVSDRDSTSTVNVSADLFSGEDTLHNSNKISSNVLSLALANSSPRSLVPETENEKSQCGTAAVPETEGSKEAFTSTASRTYSSHNSNKNLRKACEVKKENVMVYVTKGDKDHDSTMDRTTKSGFLSAEETSLAEAIQLCLEAFGRRLKVKIETYPCKNAATPEIQRGEEAFTSSSLFTDSSQQSDKITTPSRPWFYNPGSVALHSLGSDRQCVNDSGEESGNPTEHYDLSEINRLRTKLQKEQTRKANVCPVNITLKVNTSAENKVCEGTRGDKVTKQEKGIRNYDIICCNKNELFKEGHTIDAEKQSTETISDFAASTTNSDLIKNMATMLDKKSRILGSWFNLGQQFYISGEKLKETECRQFKPTLVLMECRYSKPETLTFGRFCEEEKKMRLQDLSKTLYPSLDEFKPTVISIDEERVKIRAKDGSYIPVPENVLFDTGNSSSTSISKELLNKLGLREDRRKLTKVKLPDSKVGQFGRVRLKIVVRGIIYKVKALVGVPAADVVLLIGKV